MSSKVYTGFEGWEVQHIPAAPAARLQSPKATRLSAPPCVVNTIAPSQQQAKLTHRTTRQSGYASFHCEYHVRRSASCLLKPLPPSSALAMGLLLEASLVDGVGKHPVLPIILALLSGLLLWRLWKFTIVSYLWPCEPKELPYWIPFLGNKCSRLGERVFRWLLINIMPRQDIHGDSCTTLMTCSPPQGNITIRISTSHTPAARLTPTIADTSTTTRSRSPSL